MTPRPYLSWTQFNVFSHSPAQYRQRYIFGEQGAYTRAMAFGKEMALKREAGDDEGIEHLTMFLPKYPRREYEMTAPVIIDDKEVILLGKFDGVDLRKHIIGDDKTGKHWTQAMVNKDEQLTWYSFIYWRAKGILPKLQLNWIETIEGSIATGKVETFETMRTVKDFLSLTYKIRKVWRGISQLCEKEWSSVLQP